MWQSNIEILQWQVETEERNLLMYLNKIVGPNLVQKSCIVLETWVFQNNQKKY